MKCHILFSGKNKKNISKCRLLKILPRVLSVNKALTFSLLEQKWIKPVSGGTSTQEVITPLTFTTLWAFSADDKMMLFFLFFPENRIWHFMQIVSLETICMKCQILISGKNKKNISKCRLLKILPRVLSVNFALNYMEFSHTICRL